MKRSAYPYIITGVLLLCAILAVFFLLILPGLTAAPEPLACMPYALDTPSAELEGAELLALALSEAESPTPRPESK